MGEGTAYAKVVGEIMVPAEHRNGNTGPMKLERLDGTDTWQPYR